MQRFRFGEFELDLDARQLRLRGQPVHIERRPFDLLVLLVTAEGRVVARDDIIAKLWPPKVIIDFDSGINTLVRKVRNALGDSSEQPAYIETVAGRGYRFVATITATSPAETQRRPYAAPIIALIAIVGAVLFASWPEDATPASTRIAVLPLENLTGDAGLDYMAAGIAEETSIALAKIDLPDLSVIGVVSARALAEPDVSLPKFGRELGVDFFVVSSLRFDAPRIRVTSRLLRTTDGEQVWSASFDRELTNALGLQRELSVAIAEQIRQRLSPEVAAAIDLRQTQNPVAYELYLKGRYEWTRFLPDSVPKALSFYELAVAEDPRYALAWAGMAQALITSIVTVEADRNVILPAAREALQRALELGPNLAETRHALGNFHFFIDRDVVAAETAAREAIALDPNSAMIHMFLGLVLSAADKHVEASAMLQRARELDPLFPLMFANSAYAAIMAGELELAIEYATQAIAINPQFWVGYLHLGNAHRALGHYEQAIEAYANAEKLSGDGTVRATSARAEILIKVGRENEAREILAGLMSRSTTQYVSPYYIATINAALGETDAAFEWLERAVTAGNLSCLSLSNDIRLEPLRNDLRFESQLRRCKPGMAQDNSD